MSHRRRAFAAALTFTLASMVPARAMAQAPPSAATVEEARVHYKRAVDLYGEANYAAALIEFRRAYEIAPNFSVLYNIGQIQYQMHDYAESLKTFNEYLQQGGVHVPPPRRTEVEKEIAYLKDRVGYIELSSNADGADVTVDGTVVARTPVKQPIIVTVGRRRIEIVKADRPVASRQLDIGAGDHVKVELNEQRAAPAAEAQASAAPSKPTKEPSAPAAPPPSAEQPAAEEGRGPWPTIMWTTAGVLAVGTAVTGVLSLGAAGDLSTKRNTDGATRSELDSAQSKAKTMALVTDVLGVATVLAAGAAAYLTWAPRSPRAQGPEVQVRVGAGNVSLAGTF